MAGITRASYNATNLSASAAIKSTAGLVGGVLCNSSSSGTLTLYDNTAASGTKITNALPLTAGAYTMIPGGFSIGLYATIGGSADITLFWN